MENNKQTQELHDMSDSELIRRAYELGIEDCIALDGEGMLAYRDIAIRDIIQCENNLYLKHDIPPTLPNHEDYSNDDEEDDTWDGRWEQGEIDPSGCSGPYANI